MQIDMRAMELLSSKICHDLVSPVSAINNGVELIEDIGGTVIGEALKLIGDSAGHAARRLRLFRMAYGRAGSETALAVKDVKAVAGQYMSGGKIVLHWPDNMPSQKLADSQGFLKVVLNTLLVAEETLAYGGAISLRSDLSLGKDICRFEIVGRGAHLSPAAQAALDGTASIDDLSPRTIQSYITGRFAEHFGLILTPDQSVADRLDLTLLLPETASASEPPPSPPDASNDSLESPADPQTKVFKESAL
ncbi:MAG: histidine phosphotransferase family protein [Bdellovibrionales bacterium]